MLKLFHRSRRVALCAAIVLCVFINVGGDSPLSAQSANTGWAQVPAILARIKGRPFRIVISRSPITPSPTARPTTPRPFARPSRLATRLGGRVVVTPGVFLTGAVHLKSNVNLHVLEGATLKFIPDPAKYLPVVFTRFEGTECMNYSPLIYAFEQENIAVTGKGTLDGSASMKIGGRGRGRRRRRPPSARIQ